MKVYVLEGSFNSEEDSYIFSRIFKDRAKALKAFKKFVKEEKESDFVKGHLGYETYAEVYDFGGDEKDTVIARFYFGDKNDEYYTKVHVEVKEVEE